MGDVKLTAKQELFCLEYLIDFNWTRAAIAAWYSKKTAWEMAYENLKKPQIMEYLNKKKGEKLKKAEVSIEWVIENLKQVIERSMKRVPVLVYDKKLKEHVQVMEKVVWDDWEEKMVWVWSYDAGAALKWNELIGKYLKMFTDKHELSWPNWWAIEYRNMSDEELYKLIHKE